MSKPPGEAASCSPMEHLESKPVSLRDGIQIFALRRMAGRLPHFRSGKSGWMDPARCSKTGQIFSGWFSSTQKTGPVVLRRWTCRLCHTRLNGLRTANPWRCSAGKKGSRRGKAAFTSSMRKAARRSVSCRKDWILSPSGSAAGPSGLNGLSLPVIDWWSMPALPPTLLQLAVLSIVTLEKPGCHVPTGMRFPFMLRLKT